MKEFWIVILFFASHFLIDFYFKKKKTNLLEDNIKLIQKSIDDTDKVINLQNKINKRIDKLLNQN